jgi:hypothetical protein
MITGCDFSEFQLDITHRGGNIGVVFVTKHNPMTLKGFTSKVTHHPFYKLDRRVCSQYLF